MTYSNYRSPDRSPGNSRHYSGLEAAIETAALPKLHSNGSNGYFSHAYEVFRQDAQGAYIAALTPAQQNTHSYESTAVMTSAASPAPKAETEASPLPVVIYHRQPLIFLNPARPRTPFVAAAAEISDFIKEAFSRTAGKELPGDITITVASRQMLQQIHPQFSKPGIAGLSLNGSSSGREIFAVAGDLGELMLVIGHELGHVLTPTLSSEKAEEAKAFAFEMAWANAIFLHDIAGLRNNINSAALSMRPAQNGLHDLAFAFVKAATAAGKEALQLHSQLSSQQQEFGISEFGINSSDFTIAAATNPAVYVPLISHHSKTYGSGGYRNKSNVQNVPWLQNFTWADLGKGVYGMYIPLTASIFMNDRLLRTDLEQFHKTLGHEYVLHHVMQLPDGYAAKILEETIFWVDDKKEKLRP